MVDLVRAGIADDAQLWPSVVVSRDVVLAVLAEGYYELGWHHSGFRGQHKREETAGGYERPCHFAVYRYIAGTAWLVDTLPVNFPSPQLGMSRLKVVLEAEEGLAESRPKVAAQARNWLVEDSLRNVSLVYH